MKLCSFLFLLTFFVGCSHRIVLPEQMSAYTPTLQLEIPTPLPKVSCGLVHSVQLAELTTRTRVTVKPSATVLLLDKIELNSGFRPAWDLSATLLSPDGKAVKITEHAEFNWHWKRDVVCHHAALHFPVALAALEIKALQQLQQQGPQIFRQDDPAPALVTTVIQPDTL